MPVSEEKYRMAVQAIESGEAPDDVVGGLMDIIDEYEHTRATARNPAGETGSMIGAANEGQPIATGGDLLDQRITQPEMHAEAARKQDETKRMAKEYPNLAIAMNVETADARGLLDKKKRVEEHRAHFGRPAEFIPPQPETQATSPMEAFGMTVDKARQNLPAFVGGKVEHYLEPPLSQFRREMAPRLGDRVLKMTVASDEYKQYADELWQQIYDQAKAEGRSVVRTAYKDAKTPGEKVEKFGIENIAGPLTGLAAGIDDVTFGAASGAAEAMTGDRSMRENLNRLGEISPVSRIGGEVIGSTVGMNPAKLAAQGASSLVRGGGGLGRSALRAGVGGAAAGATTAASRDIADEKGVDPQSAMIGAMLGFPLGALGGAGGELMRKGQKAVRGSLERNPSFADMQRAEMGQPSISGGIKRSDAAEGYIKQATEELGPGRVNDFMARRPEEALTTAARRLEKGTARDIGDVQGEFFRAAEGDTKPITNITNDMLKLRQGLTTADGRPIPAKMKQVKYLDDLIQGSTDVEIVPAADGKSFVPKSRPGTVDMTLEEAERAGINVTQAMKGYRATGTQQTPEGAWELPEGQAPGGEMLVRVTPRSLNPQQLEKMKSQLDLEMGFGENPHREELSSLLRSTREARDVYPARGPIKDDLTATIDTGTEDIRVKGFSAFQRQAAEKTAAVKRTLGHGGYQENVPEPKMMSSGQQDSVFSETSNYRKPGRIPDADKALRDLAGLADNIGYKGTTKQIEEAAGMRGMLELEDAAKIPLSTYFMPWRAAKLSPLARQLRLDPILSALTPGANTGASGVLGGVAAQNRGKPLPKQLSQEQLDALEQYLGPMK